MAIEEMELLDMTFDKKYLKEVLCQLKETKYFYPQPATKIVNNVKDVFTMTPDEDYKNMLDELKELHPDHIHLAPFMIVAGDHANNDMSGEDDDSWKSILEKEGYSVTCTLKGLGEIQEIRNIFIRHIREGLDRI